MLGAAAAAAAAAGRGSAPPVLRSLGYDTALASVTGVQQAAQAARDLALAAQPKKRLFTPKSAPRARATDFF
jgi:hypothetical protein